MLMRILLLAMLCGLSALAFAADEVKAADRERVQAVLAPVDPAQPGTLQTAEDALVAGGNTLLPAMRAVAAAKTNELAGTTVFETTQLLRAQLIVLDQAAVRLEWKIDPPQLIRTWVREHLPAQNKDLEIPPPLHLADARLAKDVPAVLFYLVRFRQYPVARLVPEPLAANNIFAVAKDGVRLVTDVQGLQEIFRGALPPVRDAAAAKEAAYAWLRVAQELAQDGMYAFTIPDETLTATRDGGRIVAAGKAVVKADGGNRGEIAVTMTFAEGKLADLQQTADLRPGMRPICQATKLLDPDPIVRKMAEQDLLIMGPAAIDYVLEQRAKAGPALRAAIDAVWVRVCARWAE